MLKNIIFDLGAVILNIDFQRTMDAFKNLGAENTNEFFSAYAQYSFFDEFDKGLITPEEFRNELKKFLKKNVTDEMIDKAWNAMILDFPKDRIDFLLSCKNNYSTFLLSNTNAIHFPVYNNQLQEKFNINNLSEIFEKAYYSYRLGLRKPDKEIFELVIKENNLKPAETIFIDDSPANIATANELGLRTILLNPPKTLMDVVFEIN